MRKIKKLASLILTVIMVFSVFTVVPVKVSAATGDYSLSILDDGTAEITDYSGSATELFFHRK